MSLPAPYYDDGACVIYHGDCLDLLPELSGLGALVTDPPYSSGGAYRADRTQRVVEKYVATGTLAYRADFAGDNRDQRSFLAWATLWLNAAGLRAVGIEVDERYCELAARRLAQEVLPLRFEAASEAVSA